MLRIDTTCAHLYREHAAWSKFTNVEPVDFGYTTTFDLGEWETLKRLHAQLLDAGWTGTWHTEVGPTIINQLSNLTIEDDHIVGISMPNMKVDARAFSTMMQLPNVRTINVSGNVIEGDISTLIDVSVVNVNLVDLNISSNSLSGNLAWLNDRFPALSTLTANNNCFDEIDPCIDAASINIKAQTLSDTIRWTLGPVDKQTVADAIPSLMQYNHTDKTFRLPTMAVGSNADPIYLNLNLSGDEYAITANTYYGKNYWLTINGNYDFYIKSVSGSAIDTKIPLILDFVVGDCNCDAVCDVTDLQSLLNYALGYGASRKIFNEKAVNFDGNETLNVIDIVGLVNHLLGQGAPQARVVAAATDAKPGTAMHIDGNNLMLTSVQAVSVLDFTISGGESFALSPSLKSAGFICAVRHQGNAERVIIYSLSGAEMPQGETMLGTSTGDIVDVKASSPDGEHVDVSIAAGAASACAAETSFTLNVCGHHITVPARYADGWWALYDTGGRLLGNGSVASSGQIAESSVTSCIIVITAQGHEPLSLKINQ